MTHPYKNAGRRRHRDGVRTLRLPEQLPLLHQQKGIRGLLRLQSGEDTGKHPVMDGITPRCDFVFTGGEPLADLNALQQMLDAIPATHKIYINTTFPAQAHTSFEEMLAFTERNKDKITCMNISRHLQHYVEESPDQVLGQDRLPHAHQLRAVQELSGGEAGGLCGAVPALSYPHPVPV